MKFKQITIFSLLISVFLFSCKDEIADTDSDKNNDGPVSFRVEVPKSFLTKGIPIGNASDTAFKNLGILAYHTNSEFSSSPDATSAFLPNVVGQKSEGNKWRLDKIYLWPQTGYVSFFAYAPYASAENGITIESVQGPNPKLVYTLPHEVAQQPDLMIASPQLNKFKETIPLNFNHALACIGFDVSGENVAIDSIGIKNVYTSGSVMLNLVKDSIIWEDLTGLNDTFYKVGLIENAEATNSGTDIMATNGYLMMLPQQLTNDAAIVIKFKGIDPKIIPLKNAGTSKWLAGKKYIYSLKEGTYDFQLQPSSTECVYSGGEIILDIKSKYTTQSGIIQELGWKAEVVATSTRDPYWLNDFQHLADAEGTDTLKNIVIHPTPYTTTNEDDRELRNADSITYARIKDLSLVNGTYTTANTYVVNAPGWYKFPCWVMGNAITQSSDASLINNTECINPSSQLFQDYTGKNITGISDLEIDVTNAVPKLIWSDAPGLISNLQLSNDKKYIEFYISPQSIRQGNAILSIQKNGVVMWSWQIWATTWTLSSPAQDLGSGNPSIMPFGVGRCSAATYKYLPRDITIRFTQNTSNLTKEITFTQVDETIEYGENASFYQWGRKDPMLGSNGLANAQPKECFGPAVFIPSPTSTPVSLADGILNPNIFYGSIISPGSWQTPVNVSLWGDAQTTNATWKTIYDPCPAGYQVPLLSTIFSIIQMPSEFVAEPINGCKFSPSSDGVYSVFLACNGGRGNKDSGLFGTTPPDEGGYYWSNSNFYWQSENETPASKNTFLNLIFSLNRDTHPVYYQANPGASGLNVCGSLQ